MLIKLAQAKWRPIAKKILEKGVHEISPSELKFMEIMKPRASKILLSQHKLQDASYHLNKFREITRKPQIASNYNNTNIAPDILHQSKYLDGLAEKQTKTFEFLDKNFKNISDTIKKDINYNKYPYSY